MPTNIAVDSRTELQLMAEQFVARTPANYTNTVDLYDQAMCYGTTRVQPRSLIRETVIRVGGIECQVQVTTAAIRRGDRVVDIFPGERESLVEKALRKLAAEPRDGRRTIASDANRRPHLRVCFTLSEVRKLLAENRHDYKLSELREALDVLARCSLILRVSAPDGRTAREFTGTVLQNLAIEEDMADAAGSRTLLSFGFHPAIAESLLARTFRRIDFRKLVGLRSEIARWLYLRISHNYQQACASAWAERHKRYHLALSTIIRERADTMSRTRDALRSVRRAFSELADADLIFPPYEVRKYGPKGARGPARCVDVVFEVCATQKLIDDIVAAH